jgi:hypothetical protein
MTMGGVAPRTPPHGGHAVKPGVTVRFTCGECRVVFDLCLGPASERAEVDPDVGAGEEDVRPSCCPFCGAHAESELRDLYDRPCSRNWPLGRLGALSDEDRAEALPTLAAVMDWQLPKTKE